jgi:hypothetical protein
MPETSIPYWELTTGTQGTGKPPGAMRKIAAYLNANKKVGDVFSGSEIRRDIPGAKLESDENLSRRLRELREIGWGFESYKTDSTQRVDTYILNKIGWHPELSETPERKSSTERKNRQVVSEHHDLKNALDIIDDLSDLDKLTLRRWIEQANRDTTALDKAFNLSMKLEVKDRKELLSLLAGEDDVSAEDEVVVIPDAPKPISSSIASEVIATKPTTVRNVSEITYHSDGIHPALVSTVPSMEPLNTVEAELLELFKAHKDYAILSNRNGPTGIGKTFEDLLGKEEDNLALPDFQGLIELKARDMESSSMINLFTKSPDYLPASAASFLDHKVNSYLLRNYGYLGDKGEKRLCTTLSAKETVYPKDGMFGFALEIDDANQFIHIVVIDRTTGKEVFKDAGWTYDMLLDTTKKKLQSLALISAQKRVIDGKTYYVYRHLDMIDGLDNAGLIEMIKQDIVRIDLRMKMREDGTVRDHGTGFRIRNKNLISVYKTRRLA